MLQHAVRIRAPAVHQRRGRQRRGPGHGRWRADLDMSLMRGVWVLPQGKVAYAQAGCLLATWTAKRGSTMTCS